MPRTISPRRHKRVQLRPLVLQVSPASASPRSRWLILIPLVILLGLLPVCHGCHGDEDNELLFGWLRHEPPSTNNK